MKCHGCFKLIKDISSIKCSSSLCEKHFCALCINISSYSLEKKKTWKCPDCCASTKKGGDNSSTPVRTSEDTSNIGHRKRLETNVNTTAISEIKELTSEVRHLTREISSLKKSTRRRNKLPLYMSETTR